MEQKTAKRLSNIFFVIVGCIIGAILTGQYFTIQQRNEEIDSLKEELSKVQSDMFKEYMRFGQWKLQVEELAKENGWELPKMPDSAVLVVKGPTISAHMRAEIDGDSLRIIDKSLELIDDNDSIN